jgi:glycogen debranching enzyme
MDTQHLGDDRAGTRVEIQALFYAVYDAIIYIEKLVNSPYMLRHVKEQKEFKRRIRKAFVHPSFPGLLVDGLNELGHVQKSYRPNVFLAYYLAPTLLSKKEWESCFDVYLDKLFESWGGLTPINRDNALFQPTYTGQNNKSYHRGDVWYFVNNFAVVALARLNHDKYKPYIKAILHASARDILELGFAGHGSEVSSATMQEAQACLAQAWSVSTFIEAIEEKYPSDFFN